MTGHKTNVSQKLVTLCCLILYATLYTGLNKHLIYPNDNNEIEMSRLSHSFYKKILGEGVTTTICTVSITMNSLI